MSDFDAGLHAPTLVLFVGPGVRPDAECTELLGQSGLRCVAAAWGYRDAGERIESWGADVIAWQPRDLLQPGVLAGAGGG